MHLKFSGCLSPLTSTLPVNPDLLLRPAITSSNLVRKTSVHSPPNGTHCDLSKCCSRGLPTARGSHNGVESRCHLPRQVFKYLLVGLTDATLPLRHLITKVMKSDSQMNSLQCDNRLYNPPTVNASQYDHQHTFKLMTLSPATGSTAMENEC